MIRDDTPWDAYEIDNIGILVKRDDMSVTEPGPYLSKMRGIWTLLERAMVEGWTKNICVVDDGHSVMGWGVARACKTLGLSCYNFYPVYKHEGEELRHAQVMAFDNDAVMCGLPATRFMIMYAQARNWMREQFGNDFLMLQDTNLLDDMIIEGNAKEAALTPPGYRRGTWIMPTSKAMTTSGVIRGLGPDVPISYVVYVCNAKDIPRLRKWMLDKIGFKPHDWAFVDEGIYRYEDGIKFDCPFPCNPYYDLKAWKWLSTHAHNLERPVIFWNVGS